MPRSRTLGVLASLTCLLAAACTGGEKADTSADSTADSDTERSATVISDTEPSAIETDPAPSTAPPTSEPPPEIVPLPGLLDPSDEPIPNDDTVRTGTLPNGLTYYVRHNERPGAKASLRLAIKAGSVDETGANTGVAHFVEHMLFNGTERYPKNDLIQILQGFGADFGADINAYTSYDETVYQLDVPNDDESFDTAMSVLSEWLSHATFDPEQVEAERGVVIDEWRGSTQDVFGRLFEIAEGLYLTGSAYEGRSPIGSEASIAGVSRDELKGYYDAWYRPDNAAVIVVGDIDVDVVEAEIAEVFGSAQPRSAAMPARPDTLFAIESEADFALHSDPDQTTVDVEVDLPLPAIESTGTAGARAEFIDVMIFDALVRRLQGDVTAGTAPFDDITPGTNSMVSTLDAPALYAFTDAERVNDTLQALLDEYERAHRFGFTQAELDTARDSVQAGLDAYFEGRDTIQDADYADQYIEHFLRGAPYAAAEVGYEIASEVLAAVTPEALDLRFRARWTNTAPHVIISTPEDDASAMPTRDAVLAMIADTPNRDVQSRQSGRDLPDQLMVAPEPVDEASRESLVESGDDLFDPVQVTYPNGVRVIATTNDIVAGQVFGQAASFGGSSLVSDDDVVDALFAADVVTSGGVGDFNQVELAEILAGTDVEVGAEITPYTEGFFASASTSDLEVMMQLLNQYMTAPRFDQIALDRLIADTGPLVADPGSDPSTAAIDALIDVRYSNEPRYTVLPTPEEFDNLDLAGIERVWRQRFGDASDWVFVFSGDFDSDVLFDLASRYLGTLPASGSVEQPVDVEQPAPPGVVKSVVIAGTGDTAEANMLFTTPVEAIDGELRATLEVTGEVVTTRLTNVIREQLGESYSPSAFVSFSDDPDPVVEAYVSISGAPDRIETVADLAVAELADLAANGPTPDEFEGGFAQIAESYGFINNGLFVDELMRSALQGTSLDDWFAQYSEIESVTPASVQRFIAEHLPADRYIQVATAPR